MHSNPVQFNSSKKNRNQFEVNRAAVVGMRSIGKGASAAKKLFSILNVRKTISARSWTEHTSIVEKQAKELLERELQKSIWEAKLAARKLLKPLENCSDAELRKKVVNIAVSLDCFWSSRGWSASDGAVAAISLDTGKVVDVVHLSSSCSECPKLVQRHKDEEINRL